MSLNKYKEVFYIVKIQKNVMKLMGFQLIGMYLILPIWIIYFMRVNLMVIYPNGMYLKPNTKLLNNRWYSLII
jgi:hypothetical protein